MFELYENFLCCDDNKQPYSFNVERHTDIDNLHAKVENGVFALNSIGNRFIFNTPELSGFSVEITFGFTCIYEFKPNFNVIFYYNKKTRTGEGLRLQYNLDKTVTLSYISVNGMNVREISSVTISDIEIKEGEKYRIDFSVKNGILNGIICENKFSFKVSEQCGYIALERKNYIGALLLYDCLVTSEDAITETLLVPERTVDIPLNDGGDIPYKLTWKIQKENEVTYIYLKLDGGTSTREKNKDDRPGQYLAETDILRTPYVLIVSGIRRSEKIYFFNDSEILSDSNVYWECLKAYWNCPEIPIEKKVAISESLADDNMNIIYGYDKFEATGYMAQAGNNSEFVFDSSGKLLYGGSALGESVFEIKSPQDKMVLSYVPDDCYEYDAVLKHLKDNHYFSVDEPISLGLIMRTRLNPEYIKIKAQIRDIYDREIIADFEPSKVCESWLFGYQSIMCNVEYGKMKEGLYRIAFFVYYGDSVYKRIERVFEVYDENSKISPATAVGLPYVFSMPNEQKWLSRNTFDLWNPMPSCDCEHFISAVTDTPVEAERKKVWKVIKPFKREWFAWLEHRTCKDWNLENHIDVVKNCDYLYYPAPVELYPLRNDIFLLRTYLKNRQMRIYLYEFLSENSLLREQLSFNVSSEGDVISKNEKVDFTYDMLKELLNLCYCEWLGFVQGKLNDNILHQNRELAKINKNFKRSAYGPFNQYTSCTLSYHSIRAYGLIPDERLSKNVYTGFAIFEDYPYACSYQTYRGAFGVMTTLLHVPNLRLYPEQYSDSSYGGCIDGAVKFAHAPMGAYVIEPYMNSTHMFEFVFNTPYHTEKGYRYWNTYAFHRRDFSAEQWDRVVRDWKYVLDYKPKRPLKTIAFAADYTDKEDVFDKRIKTLADTASVLNRSEQAHGYLYDCCREAGINAGFAIKLDALDTLKANECSALILPTLKYAGADVINEIRRLHGEGVALIAVSDISGLEDLFGVHETKQKVNIDTICYDGEKENIYPVETELYYSADMAETVLCSEDGLPIVMKYNNALLLNAATTDLGYECFEGMEGKGRRSISKLLRRCIKSYVRSLNKQPVLGDNVGVTLFETEFGDTVLMAIDYTPFDNRAHSEKMAVVRISMQGIYGAVSDTPINQVKNEKGELVELRFPILPHGFSFIKLLKA